MYPLATQKRAMRATEQGNLVKRRCERWAAGSVLDLWREVQTEVRSNKRIANTRSLKEIRFARCVRLVHQGALSRAVDALASNGVRKASETVIQELKNKHPQEPAVPCPAFDQPLRGHRFHDAVPHKSFTRWEVLAAVKKAPTGTSAGPSGLTFGHLAELLRVDRVKPQFCPGKLIGQVADLDVRNMLDNDTKKWLMASRLIPL